MATTIEKAATALLGIGSADPDLATNYISATNYIEHNPRSGDGVAGLRSHIGRIAKEEHHLEVVRVFRTATMSLPRQMGSFSVRTPSSISLGLRMTRSSSTGFFLQKRLRRTRDIEKTEKNKSFLREYYETFHISGDHSDIDRSV